MGVPHWFSLEFTDLLAQILAVIGLWFAAITLRSDNRTHKIANLFALQANHQALLETRLKFKEMLHRFGENRTLDPAAPLTDEESIYMNMMIQHASSAFYALRYEEVVPVEGLRRDIAETFSNPVARAAWEKLKSFQNKDFVDFVESCLTEK